MPGNDVEFSVSGWPKPGGVSAGEQDVAETWPSLASPPGRGGVARRLAHGRLDDVQRASPGAAGLGPRAANPADAMHRHPAPAAGRPSPWSVSPATLTLADGADPRATAPARLSPLPL